MRRLLANLPRAIEHWDARDATMARLARQHPPQPWKEGGVSAFEMLCASLINQQISVAAGRTITRSFRAALGGVVTPASVRAAHPRTLQAAGLSAQKRSYIRDLAQKFATGAIRPATFTRLSDEGVVAALTEVRGIGVWTAKMFLIGHLVRPDVLAEEDLGLQLAAARAYGVPRSRARALLLRRGKAWAPWRTLASLVLWTFKDHAK